MKTATWAKWAALVTLLLIALAPGDSLAAVDNADLLDKVLQRYGTAASRWAVYMTDRASWLFWTLVLISMIFTFGLMGLRRADLGELFAEFLRFTTFTGFFWWLLINGPAFATGIMDSLRRIGAEASGLEPGLMPSGIVDIGFAIFSRMVDMSSLFSPVDSIFGLLISLGILIVFALVGVNMLLLLVSGWLLAYAGIFFLGFGGARWTSDMAINYYRTVLNLAVQLCVMVLLIGIGKSVVDEFYTNMSNGITLKEMGVMLVVAVVLLALVHKVPGLIGGIAGGNGSAFSGFGAGTAMGAAAMLGASMATAGAAAVAGAAGGASAVKEAFSKAAAGVSDSGKIDSFMSTLDTSSSTSEVEGNTHAATGSLADAMGTGSDRSDATPFARATQGQPDTAPSNTDSATATAQRDQISDAGADSPAQQAQETDSNSRSTGTRASALTTAGRIAAGTAANLARGSVAVASEQIDGLRQDASARIGRTIGGRVAAAIRATPASQDPGFDGDAIGPAPAGAPDREAEVAAFRDRYS